MASQDTGEIVALDVALTTHVGLERISEMFGSAAAPWLGEPVASTVPGYRQFACDLELRVSPEGRATFRKSAIVGLGEPRCENGAWIVPIQWQAGTLAPLFPVFAGNLRIGPNAIELTGNYAPPGGRVGYILDRAVLHIAARRTATWFVKRAAAAMA